MTDEEVEQRTSWVPIGIAGGLVAVILAAVLLIDGSADESEPDAPASPIASSTG